MNKQENELKHLPKDLITSSYSKLSEINEEYANYAKMDHDIASQLIPSLKKANKKGQNYQGCKAVVQSLFESGFISVSDGDFNTEQMFNYIYGVKCVSAIPAFEKLHAWLIANEYTDHIGTQEPSSLYESKGELKCFKCFKVHPSSHNKEDGCKYCTSTENTKTWNASGDNYYSAYRIENKLTDQEQYFVDKYPDTNRPKTYTRVIVVENQSPMWAYIVKDHPLSGEPNDLTIVRLKCNYNDKDRLTELLELVKNDDLNSNRNWSASNDTTRHGVIAHVNIDEMKCDSVLQPKHIESALFNIYSGFDCIE